MAWGIRICSTCNREVHQIGRRCKEGKRIWEHCEDRTTVCEGAKSIAPKSKDDIQGEWCGCDEEISTQSKE